MCVCFGGEGMSRGLCECVWGRQRAAAPPGSVATPGMAPLRPQAWRPPGPRPCRTLRHGAPPQALSHLGLHILSFLGRLIQSWKPCRLPSVTLGISL